MRDYVEQEEIPYNDLYKLNIIQTYPKELYSRQWNWIHGWDLGLVERIVH